VGFTEKGRRKDVYPAGEGKRRGNKETRKGGIRMEGDEEKEGKRGNQESKSMIYRGKQ
jgi:hypothetical protein